MHWLRSIRARLFDRQNSKGFTRARKHASRLSVRALEDRVVPSVAMVSDINGYTLNSYPSQFTSVTIGSTPTVFFLAQDNTGTNRLFESTAAGSATQLTFGGQLSQLDHLVSFNNVLYFTAYDSNLNEYALYSSNGTVAGTQPVEAGGVNVSPWYWQSSSYGVVGSKLFFEAYDPSNQLRDLWVTNGTPSGTHAVQPGSTTTANAYLEDFTAVGSKLYFEGYNPSDSKYTLWVSDGTPGGTNMVTELTTNQATNFISFGNKLYFEMYDSANSRYALWKSDGTAGGTIMVSDIGTSGNTFNDPIVFSNKLYFQAPDATNAPNTGYALWVYDGTNAPAAFKFAGGATPVQVSGSVPMAVMGSNLYFSGYDTTHSYSLWKTDGVSANSNTATVQTTGASPFNQNPNYLAVVGSKLYFRALSTTPNAYVLWTSDGTNSGTGLVQTSGYGYDVSQVTTVGTKVFFEAYDVDANNNSPHGYEPWVSDGTNGGTLMVADIRTDSYSSNPAYLRAAGNELFFAASSYNPNGGFYWQTDGTAAHTAAVQTSTGLFPTSEQNGTVVGNSWFFTATDPTVHGTSQYQLWVSGTALHSAVDVTGGLASNPFGGNFASNDGTSFVSFNGLLYFGAYDQATSKWALWKSDGTQAGTTVVADLSTSYAIKALTVVGSNLYWGQYDSAASTYALWTYNGTTASQVVDINNGGNGFSQLTAVGSQLFFEAYNNTSHYYSLWTSNGTAGGTMSLGDIGTGQQIFNLTAFNNKLYFAGWNTTLGTYQMWTSDGTAGGTAQLFTSASQPVDIYNNGTSNFLVAGNLLYFGMYDYGSGFNVLAMIDTSGNVTEVQGGSYSSAIGRNPTYLANDNGIIVFDGYSSAYGYELWQSDGTASGTVMTADIEPGTGSSSPAFLTVAGNQVFFNAYEDTHRNELWSATLGATVVTAGLSGPSDGVTMQHRDFVLTGTDSNSGNNAAGFSFAINWGDGTTETLIGQSGLTADHQYASTSNAYTISVTATNLTDGVSSVAVTQTVAISATEIQNGNMAVGGLPGNDAITITKGTKANSFTVTYSNGTINTTPLLNFIPATGQQIQLYGGNGTNTITATDSGTSKDTITLGQNYVTFVKPQFVNEVPATWTITGNNSTSGNTFNIVGPANASITGGSGPDTFNFSTTGTGASKIYGSLSGTLNGGGGANVLSYKKYTTATGSNLIVDLLLGSATGIDGGANGGLSNVENIVGSAAGGDILVGDANANSLTANKGHNILIGGSKGGDTLTAGQYDILIAGTTNYDTNIAALQTIYNTWKTATSSNYLSVINTISNSSFADPLNTSTVSDSGSPDAADTLKAHTASDVDWFFANTTGSGTLDTVNTLSDPHIFVQDI